jgi:lipoyl(octanoyl) transferase
VEYADGLKLQALFGQARRAGLVGDTLLLLEHPPVLTLGRAAKQGNLLAPREQLERMGVEVHETDRGGDVTYHGPGQVVGYPIFLLPPERQDVRRYVRDVEECVIRTVGRHGLSASRISRWPGVWLGSEAGRDARKIGAIGIHLSRWLTSHGFALNVNTDLSHFQWIVPCGIQEAGVTSLSLELGGDVPLAQVQGEIAEVFGEVFDQPVVWSAPHLRTVSVVAVRESTRGPEVLVLQRTAERGGFWQVVTGRVEGDETPEGAARRELLEETGGDFEVSPLGYTHQFAMGETLPPEVVEETAFVAQWAGQDVNPSPEHQGYEWVSADVALERIPYAGLRRAVKLAIRRLAGT